MFRLFRGPTAPASVHDSMTGTPLQSTQPGTSFAGHLEVPATSVRTNAPFVTRVPRNADRVIYSRGARVMDVFHMRMTGGVESSLANVHSARAGIQNAIFNDKLFEGGYPRNTGISVKLETVAPDLKQGQGSKMVAAPQARVSIFTRRAFTGSATKPAKPASS